MKHFFIAFLLFTLMSFPAFAMLEKEYHPAEPMVTTPWFGNVGAAQREADLGFVAGMRPHHAGALTMSSEYLSDPQASDPTLQSLARGIIHNQQFEIGLLNALEKEMKAVKDETRWQKIANEGQAQRAKFQRAPMPANWHTKNMSARDVQFAKAMIIHHQGALDMANDYLQNPDAGNGYLKQFCLDILLDQSQEIALMNNLITAYPGNPDTVKITPNMIHGMDGMMHSGHTGH